jgi:hypothetical protein
VCSYDAVSLFYLELYVKSSIYLSIYRPLLTVKAHLSSNASLVDLWSATDETLLNRLTWTDIKTACCIQQQKFRAFGPCSHT